MTTKRNIEEDAEQVLNAMEEEVPKYDHPLFVIPKMLIIFKLLLTAAIINKNNSRKQISDLVIHLFNGTSSLLDLKKFAEI